MTEEDFKLMSSLPPEALKQMMGLGTIDDQSGLLQQQMAMAEALRSPDTKNYGSVAGNIGAGLGNVAGALFGGHQQQELMGQQRGLIAQKQQGRDSYANALVEALRNQFGQKPPATQQPAQPQPQPQQGQWLGPMAPPNSSPWGY